MALADLTKESSAGHEPKSLYVYGCVGRAIIGWRRKLYSFGLIPYSFEM